METSTHERHISVPENVSNHLLMRVSSSRDRTQALNIIKTCNAALSACNSIFLEFEVIYEAVQPTYSIDFFTGDREVSLSFLTLVLDHRQIVDAIICPHDRYGPGYVRIIVQKMDTDNNNNHSEKRTNKRKRQIPCQGADCWTLKPVKLCTIPDMSSWSTHTDQTIAREILEYTYGMHTDMPILVTSILRSSGNRDQYTILCENVPAIHYGFLTAMLRRFPTFVKVITLNVELRTLRYTVRMNESSLSGLSLLLPPSDEDGPRKRSRWAV